MINYLPDETRLQVIKNKIYVDNIERVHSSQKASLFEFIMKNGTLPRITSTGYILQEVDLALTPDPVPLH